jgi:YggT family protein
MIMIGLILYYMIRIYIFIVFVRALFSWLQLPLFNPVYRFLVKITDPILLPVKRRIGVYRSGNIAYDLSPIIVILILYILERVVVFIFFHKPIAPATF